MFGRRKKWNAQVAERLLDLNLTIEDLGLMSSIAALDLVYPKGFSPEEGALYLGFLAYQSYLSENPAKAHKIKWQLYDVGSSWVSAGKAGSKLVEAYWEKARDWEAKTGPTDLNTP